MGERRRITEYLDLDLGREMWVCNRCGRDLISARENYKKGCLVHDRDPRTIHRPVLEGEKYTFSPDPDWCRIVEFYCPQCGAMIENEYLPPGHPITHDIELDLDALKAKTTSGSPPSRTLPLEGGGVGGGEVKPLCGAASRAEGAN